MVKTVKEIKEKIKMYILPEYSLRTNFSSEEFLVEIGNGLIIKTKSVIDGDKVIYRFMLDIQFLSTKEVTYDELCMIKSVIDVLEDNRKFVLSKFKKYTVEELLEEQKLRQEESRRMIETLEKAVLIMHERNGGNY